MINDSKSSNIDFTKFKDLLFPHSKVREIQDILIEKIVECISKNKHLLVHAPTGLGKTAAALSAALTHLVRENNSLTIFFLTARHTQHKIVLETLSKINEKFNINITSNSIIGKKHLCLQPSMNKMSSKDFSDFCRLLVDNNKCDYYNNVRLKGKVSIDVDSTILNLRKKQVVSAEEIILESNIKSICPYEVSLLLAKDANVIIADYQYIFNPSIRDIFLKKLNKELKDCIVIVDEAHNLPSRIKDLSSEFLSSFQLRRAISEAKKFNYVDIAKNLKKILDMLEEYSFDLEIDHEKENNSVFFDFNDSNSYLSKKKFESSEKYISKDKLIDDLKKNLSIDNYEEFVSELFFVSSSVREAQNISYIGSVANFLYYWTGPDEGFTRILSLKKYKNESLIILSYRCLDPSFVSSSVIRKTYSTILMSGTLTPTYMYKEILGIDAEELTLQSPFPKENRLNLIIPKTTTKYESRNEIQYVRIAETLADIIKEVNGSVAIYFPSYFLKDEIAKKFMSLTKKTVFNENPDMSKREKQEFLSTFVKYKDVGAILLAVINGSFSEGIDLPGVLKMVIIVGLPLQKPDLETKALIDYYDKKFSKGWDYGYLFPAFTKAIQAAGRCIRSEKDKGIIVFLDERYVLNNYYRCFPQYWSLKVSLHYRDIIRSFYN